MAFENVFRGIDYGMQGRAQEAEANRLQQAIGRGIAQAESAKDRELRSRQLDVRAEAERARLEAAQAKAAGNYKQVAMDELYRIQQGGQQTPEGQAAIQVMSQTSSPRTYIDQMTQQVVTQPSPWAGLVQQDQRPPQQMGGIVPQSQPSQPPLGAMAMQPPPQDLQVQPMDLQAVEKAIAPFQAGQEFGGRGKIKELDVKADIFKETAREDRAQVNLQKYNQSQLESSNFANRMVESKNFMEAVLAKDPEAQEGRTGIIGGIAQALDILPLGEFGTSLGEVGIHLGASPEQQQYLNGAENWITANLRSESGAVIAASEMAKEYKKYFPMPGDSGALKEQKASLRKEAEKGMIGQSAGAYQLQHGKKSQALKSRPQITPDQARAELARRRGK